MCPLPRKCRAIGRIDVFVHPALDHHVDLDRREAGGRGRVDALEHARDREIDVVHRAKRRVVERIEADGDAREARRAQRLRLLREQRAVGGEREIDARQLGEQLDQPLDVPAQQRLAAGQPDLGHAGLDEDASRRGRSPRTSAGPRAAGTGSRRRRRPSACSRRSGNCTGRSPRCADRAADGGARPSPARLPEPWPPRAATRRARRDADGSDERSSVSGMTVAMNQWCRSEQRTAVDVNRARDPGVSSTGCSVALVQPLANHWKSPCLHCGFPIAVDFAVSRSTTAGSRERWEPFAVEFTPVEGAACRPAVASALDATGASMAIRMHVRAPRSEAEGYYLNLTSSDPKAFVMWRLTRGGRTPPLAPVRVTVSYNEAARSLDGGETVDPVPMPAGISCWMRPSSPSTTAGAQAEGAAQRVPFRGLFGASGSDCAAELPMQSEPPHDERRKPPAVFPSGAGRGESSGRAASETRPEGRRNRCRQPALPPKSRQRPRSRDRAAGTDLRPPPKRMRAKRRAAAVDSLTADSDFTPFMPPTSSPACSIRRCASCSAIRAST